MTFARALLISLCAYMVLLVGCASDSGSGDDDDNTESAVIVGQIASTTTASRQAGGDTTCPALAIRVNDVAATIEVSDTCDFLITDVPVTDEVVIEVELIDHGIVGTITLSDVEADEIIEIVVDPGTDALAISVTRRATPVEVDDDALPEVITDENVALQLAAGLYVQDLTVQSNNVSITGEAGVDCTAEEGWTTIGGTDPEFPVTILGNDTLFRNVMFAGPVALRGNGARFINVCFGDDLVVFGQTPVHSPSGP